MFETSYRIAPWLVSIKLLYSRYYLTANLVRKITSIALIIKKRNGTSGLIYHLQVRNRGLTMSTRYNISLIRSTITQAIQKVLLGLLRQCPSFLSSTGLQYSRIGSIYTTVRFYLGARIVVPLYKALERATLLRSSYIRNLYLDSQARIISRSYIDAFRSQLSSIYAILRIELTSNFRLTDCSVGVLVGFRS